jgi:phytoene dehydrogenase-like protein
LADRDEHDVVIIGAGISGLFAGNYLVRRGLSVLILESEGRAGGYVRGFWRRGFYFNAGVQSFSSNGILFPALRQLGIDTQIEFQRADYRWVTPWADFRVESVDEVVQVIGAAFPDSQRELAQYFRVIRPWTCGARRLSKRFPTLC